MVRKTGIGWTSDAPRRWASHIEDMLDEALMETFPASDPVAICIDQIELIEPRHSDERAPHKRQIAPPLAAGWRD
jgi:hypothetical protein